MRARCCTRGDIDLGMIPSIEYLRGPGPYRIVPGLGDHVATARWRRSRSSRASPIARDSHDRAGHQLADVGRAARILLPRAWRIDPAFEPLAPDAADARRRLRRRADHRRPGAVPRPGGGRAPKIDLGEEWTRMTGPAVRLGVLGGPARRGRRARGRGAAARRAIRGVAQSDAIADGVLPAPSERAVPGAI